MYVKEIWRFPVKSLRGESLRRVEIHRDGLEGDRAVLVRGPRGILTSRTKPMLLGLSATLGRDGDPLIDGRPWYSDASREAVRAAAGETAELVASDPRDRFDVLPLLVATDGAIAAFARDARRLRPNLVIGGVSGLSEREWEGRWMVAGEALIALDSLRARCVMTTFHPDTLEQDVDVLRDIRRRFGGALALNAYVVETGSVSIGDPVRLVP